MLAARGIYELLPFQHLTRPENHWLPPDLFPTSKQGQVIPPRSWHEDDQSVEGVVIGLEDDQKLRRAIAAVPNIRFYRYQISFKLIDG